MTREQRMRLPNDVPRCAGTHRQECKDCLRRTSPSSPDRQVWIGVWVLPEPCESRIPLKEARDRTST